MFQIIFEGLIAFVRIPSTTVTRAVLIRDAGHTPMLRLEDTDFDPNNPSNNPLPKLAGAPPGQTRYNLDSQLLTIGLPSGATTLHGGRFDDLVPNLIYALQGDHSLDAEIFGATLHANAYAYVDLKGGTLQPIDCFDPQVTWSIADNKLPICIARSVQFSIDIAGSVKLTNSIGQWFTVRNGATLHLSNHKYGGNHFQMYKYIASQATDISVPTETKFRCEQCSPTNQPFADSATMAGMDMGGSGA